MIKAYKYRIYPTKAQAEVLLGWMEKQRWLWNFSLADRTAAWEERGERLYFYSKSHPEQSQCRHLTKSRSLYPAFAEVPVALQQGLLKRVDIAFQSFFRRVKKGGKPGYPRYKRFGSSPNLVWQGAGSRTWIRNGQLSLPKLEALGLGKIKMIMHRPMPEGYKMKTVALRCVAREKWYVSLGHENYAQAAAQVEPKRCIGIDMGLSSYLTTSNGQHIYKPNFYKEAERKRTKLQRQLARKKKRSKNWVKTLHKLQLAQHDVANARAYFQQTLSREILDQYDLIAAEDLDIAEMQEQKKKMPKRVETGLHRNIADAGWGKFLWMLEYKAEEEGKTFVRVPPRGTTQECSRCGATVHKTLRDRVHNCPYCGLVMDRDENAAKNILARGFEQLGLCQPDVKPVEVTA